MTAADRYATPTAFRRALTDRLKSLAGTSRWTVPQLPHGRGRGVLPGPALPHVWTVKIGCQRNLKSFGMIDFDLLAVT